MHISADFITKLPLAQRYNSILVVVDRLTKMVHFVPTTEKTSAEGLARLFKDNVWKLHGLSKSIISDRGPQFVARLMQELNEMLEIKSKLSTAFYPQIDGQTERVNQELEQYLRMFINHRQEQWPEWLGTAKFAYNNKMHSSTWMLLHRWRIFCGNVAWDKSYNPGFRYWNLLWRLPTSPRHNLDPRLGTSLK